MQLFEQFFNQSQTTFYAAFSNNPMIYVMATRRAQSAPFKSFNID